MGGNFCFSLDGGRNKCTIYIIYYIGNTDLFIYTYTICPKVLSNFIQQAYWTFYMLYGPVGGGEICCLRRPAPGRGAGSGSTTNKIEERERKLLNWIIFKEKNRRYGDPTLDFQLILIHINIRSWIRTYPSRLYKGPSRHIFSRMDIVPEPDRRC